jgi:catechol 2,3-dioxygenase-like lactoylglutathione lyase family enzyme
MSTTVDYRTEGQRTRPSEMLRIVQVSVPVSDLARSAAWYRDLLGLEYVREFGDEHRVTGCALADFAARYMIALRLRSSTAGEADLRGEHPIILEASDVGAAERLRARAAALGVPCTTGVHRDGSWTEFVDPDGICLRVVHDAAGPETFLGVRMDLEGAAAFYAAPRLRLPPTPGASGAAQAEGRAAASA